MEIVLTYQKNKAMRIKVESCRDEWLEAINERTQNLTEQFGVIDVYEKSFVQRKLYKIVEMMGRSCDERSGMAEWKREFHS